PGDTELVVERADGGDGSLVDVGHQPGPGIELGIVGGIGPVEEAGHEGHLVHGVSLAGGGSGPARGRLPRWQPTTACRPTSPSAGTSGPGCGRPRPSA